MGEGDSLEVLVGDVVVVGDERNAVVFRDLRYVLKDIGQVRDAEVDVRKVCAFQFSTRQAETRASDGGPDELGVSQVRVRHILSRESCAAEVRRAEIGSRVDGCDDLGNRGANVFATLGRVSEDGEEVVRRVQSRKVLVAQICSRKHGSIPSHRRIEAESGGQSRHVVAEVRIGEVHTRKVCTGVEMAGRNIAEVRIAEIGSFVFVAVRIAHQARRARKAGASGGRIDGPADRCAVEVGAVEHRSRKIRTADVTIFEVSSAQIETGKIVVLESRVSQLDATAGCQQSIGIPEFDELEELGCRVEGPRTVLGCKSSEARITEICAVEVGPGKLRAVNRAVANSDETHECGPAQVGTGEAGVGHAGAGEVGAAQVEVREIQAAQVRAAEVDAGE